MDLSNREDFCNPGSRSLVRASLRVDGFQNEFPPKTPINMENIQEPFISFHVKYELPTTTQSQSHRRHAMEPSDSIVTFSSPPEGALLSEEDSLFASLLCDITQQVHVGMENMLKMMNEIDQCSNEIVEDLDKCKKSTTERKKILEDDKECFQKVALSVLDMLNNEGLSKTFNPI